MIEGPREAESDLRAAGEPRGRQSDRSGGVRLLDALILIAATAVGLAGLKAVTQVGPGKDYLPAEVLADVKSRGFLAGPYHLFYPSELISPVMLAWTLALLPIATFRGGFRRAWRRPGSLVSGAAWAVLACEATSWALLSLPRLWGSRLVTKSLTMQLYPLPFLAYVTLLAKLGDAVVVAWVALALSGRWRSEPTWVDRAGRVLGLLWILQTPLFHWASIIKR